MKKQQPPPDYNPAFEKKIAEAREYGTALDSPFVIANLCAYCIEHLYHLDVPVCSDCNDKLVRLFGLLHSEPVVVTHGEDCTCEVAHDEEDMN